MASDHGNLVGRSIHIIKQRSPTHVHVPTLPHVQQRLFMHLLTLVSDAENHVSYMNSTYRSYCVGYKLSYYQFCI